MPRPMTPTEVKAAQKKLGLTNTELAAKMGVAVSTVSHWRAKGAPAPVRLAFAALKGTRK